MQGRGYQVGFGPPHTPDIIKYLMIANVGVYILQHLTSNPGEYGLIDRLFAVWPQLVWQGGYFWQPATYMWLHSTASVFHLLFNMFALWMFGSPVASYWGDRRFLRFYLVCGIGAGLIIAAWPALLVLFGSHPAAYTIPTLGASGAVFGVLLAYSLTWPDRTIMLLFPPIPIKAIWFIPFLFFMEFFSSANVSHVGHLGGVLVGWILLQRMGVGGRFGLGQIKYRYRRWKMRRNLRAVQSEERRRDDHRTFH